MVSLVARGAVTQHPPCGKSSALAAPGDPATGQIIGRELDGDLVAGIDADEIHAHLAGDVRHNLVAVGQLHLEGHVCRSFYLCHGVQEADALINLCKMKTHALERITGAVKNLYGCVTGVNKAAGHAAHPDSEAFADMLADLHRCVKPRLHIMDGIVAMEGNGPTSGTPVAMNVLLFSTDPVALDALFAALVHLNPAEVPTCVSGAREGLGTMTLDDIDVVTPDGVFTVSQAAARYGKADFNVFRGQMRKSLVLKLVPLLPFLQHRPKVDRRKCVACGICEQACPVPGKAVHSGHGQKARYDYHKCIRCYCCQEMCPAKAIEVYRSPIAKMLSGK